MAGGRMRATYVALFEKPHLTCACKLLIRHAAKERDRSFENHMIFEDTVNDLQQEKGCYRFHRFRQPFVFECGKVTNYAIRHFAHLFFFAMPESCRETLMTAFA
jgi:hypothetical protein